MDSIILNFDQDNLCLQIIDKLLTIYCFAQNSNLYVIKREEP